MNWFKRVRAFQIELEFGSVGSHSLGESLPVVSFNLIIRSSFLFVILYFNRWWGALLRI